MVILNYATKMDAGKTVAALQQLLVKAGCHKVLIDYDETREPIAVTFRMPVSGR